MSKGPTAQEEPKKMNRPRKQAEKPSAQKPAADKTSAPNQSAARPITILQQRVGNRAVQRFLAQRAAAGPAELDDETAGRINRQRGGGQPLDSGMQKQMSESTGEDFSQVKVHTDPEADTLSQQLGAKAFTTGQDVFFRSGTYQPQSSGGQELLAHELTHVVQQRGGGATSAGDGGKMQVNAPGDAYEQQADAVAHDVTSGQASGGHIQRAEVPEDETALQRQEDDEDEQVQMAPEDDEETEQVQRQEDDEEEQNMKAGH